MSTRPGTARAALALALLIAAAPPAPAQAPLPSAVSVTRVTKSGSARVVRDAPVIDGRLDEAAWAGAQAFNGFVQREPTLGEPVSERTEVRILTDGDALYVGAWLYDRDAAGIIPGEKVRDGTLTSSDYFALILDTYHDRQNGFVFATTPAGIEYDGQVIREGEGGGVFQQGQTRAQSGTMGGFNVNWDGSWSVATSRDSAGWYAEFRIPFATLRYGAGSTQTWGLNLARLIRRRNEESFWAFIPRQFSLYRVSLAGTLDGLAVPVRRIATLTPYVIASARRDFLTETSTRYPRDMGVDAKLGVTPSLTLDLTYNTDFAQVEVDDQRVNLTRFPLFFPEKRPFFLENAGVFSAGTPQAIELFFTRRIGIDSTGAPLPILGGGRLSGRAGGTTVGLLEILTKDVAQQAGQSYTVARAIREVARRSRIGFLGVQRARSDSSADYNRTYAIDGRIGLGDDWTIDWWGAKTETPARRGDDFGYSVRAVNLTNDWNNNLRVLQTGSGFNPEVGFLNRSGGYRFYEAQVMRYLRKPEWPWFRVWNPHVTFRGYFGLDGSYQSGQVHLDLTEFEFTNGTRGGPEANVYHEGLLVPFAIAPGVTIPAGQYDWTGIGLDLTTNPSADLSMVLRGDFGPFYRGTRNGGLATITLRRGASLSSSLIVDYSDVRLPEGNFVRSVIGTRIAWFFTPRVFVQTLAQHNNQARVWSMNTRFGWLSTAGTGLFVVFNDGEEADGFFEWRRPLARSLTVKFTKQVGSGG